MLLLILACGVASSPDTARSDTAWVDETAVDNAWTLGAVETCTAPLSEAAWRDDSLSLDGEAAWSGDLDESGAVTLSHLDGAWHIVASRPRGVLAGGDIGEGSLEPLPLDGPFIAAEAADLDENGSDDLLVWNETMQLEWDTTGDFISDVIPASAARSIIDVVTGDFNGDGYIDLVAAYRDLMLDDPDNPDVTQTWSSPTISWGQGGTFSPPEELLPGHDDWGAAFDLVSLDWDDDGDLDLYICNDGPTDQPNRPLCNDGGTFSACDARGADVATYCMGVSTGDMNADGRLDLYIGASGEHRLLIDSAGGFYDDTAARIGLPFDDGQMVWGSAMVDLNNDGRTDLLSANADFTMGDGRWPLWAFLQQEDGHLAEVGESLGFPRQSGGRAVATADLNGDGVLDIVMGDMTRPPWLFVSQGCTAEGWLEVTAPPDTLVVVEADGITRAALTSRGPGYAASTPPIAHFGLGDAERIDRVTLRLPDGSEEILEGPLAPRRRLTFTP